MSSPVASRKKSKILFLVLGLLLGLTLLVVFAPLLFGGLVARRVESEFAQRFEGQMKLGELHLAWRERQSLADARLLDPQGDAVGKLSVELPSLLELLQSDGVRLGRITAQLEARLVADDAGITNLQRALQPRKPAPTHPEPEAKSDSPSPAKPFDPQQLELEFILQAPSIAWSDANTRIAGADFEIREFWLRVRAEPGKALDLELRGSVSGGGALQGRVQIDGLRSDLGQPFARALADLDIRGLSSGLIDGIAQTSGEIPALLGPALDLSLHLESQGLDSGRARIGLASDRAQLNLEASLRERVLKLEGERGAELSLRVPIERVQTLLPSGYLVQSADPLLRVQLRLPKLEMRLDFPQEPSLTAWAGVAAAMQMQAQLSIPGPLSVQTPQLAPANLQVLARDLMARLVLQPGQPAEASLAMLLDTGLAGTLRTQVRAPQLFESIQAGREPQLEASLSCTDLSTALVDAVTGREGLLSEAIGRGIDLDLKLSEASPESARVNLSVRSAQLDLNLRGLWTPTRFVAGGDDGAELVFSPEPRWWMQHLPAQLGAAALEVRQPRLKLKARSVELPLDFSDWKAVESGLSAALELDLPVLEWIGGQATLRLQQPTFQVSVARGGGIAAKLESKLAQPEVGRVDVLLESGPWSALMRGEIPPVTLDLRLDDLNPAVIQVLAGLDQALDRRLGERADVQMRATGLSEQGGELRMSLKSPKWNLDLQARGEQRSFLGEVTLEGALAQADLDAELARFAPADLKLTRRDDAPLRLHAGKVRFRLPAREQFGDSQAWLGELALDARLSLPAMAIAHPALEESGLKIAAQAIEVETSWKEQQAQIRIGAECVEESRQLEALLGTRLNIAVQGEGNPAEPRLRLRVDSERLALAMEAGRTADQLALIGKGLELDWKPDAARCAAELRSLLPEGILLTPLVPDAFTLTVRTQELSLSLPEEGGNWLAGLRGRVRATLPSLSLRLAGPESAPLEIARADLDADLAGNCHLDAQLGADASGSLRLDLASRAPLDAVLRDMGPVQIALDARGVPLAAIDALVDPHGMLTEMLGPRVDLEIRSENWSAASGELKGRIRSDRFAVDLEGSVGTGGVRVTKPGGLTASFGLGPLSSENLLGGVLPMVCAITKPAESAPARLEVQSLALPADGDLSKLDAELTLELGDIQYSWLPGLADALGSAATPERTRLKSFPIRIQQGVVRYEKLPLKLGGREVLFSGSYQLADNKLALSFGVPLEILGRKVSKELEKARDFLDPKLIVPLEIRGTPTSPKLSLGKGFIESVVKKALEKQLQKGLESLFSDDEEKPKKP
jgi:hypothetical protein